MIKHPKMIKLEKGEGRIIRVFLDGEELFDDNATRAIEALLCVAMQNGDTDKENALRKIIKSYSVAHREGEYE